MRKAVLETAFAAGTSLLALLGLIEAWRYHGEGGLMPRGVLALMLVLSLIWLAQSGLALGKGGGAVISVTPAQRRGAICLVLAGLALMLGMRYLGFYTTAAIVVPALAWALGYRDVKGLVIGTALFVLLLVAVFHLLLKVPLPPELVLSPFGG